MRAYDLTVSGSTRLSGSLIPEGSGSHDLGTSTNPWKDLHVMSSSIHIYDTSGQIAKLGAVRGRGFKFADKTGALTALTGSHLKLSGIATATQFVGGGAGITGVTAEWDGTHTGNGVITGNFDVSGNISGSSTSTGSFAHLEATVLSSAFGTKISGSFTSVSSSLASRITAEEGEAEGSVVSSSAQIAADISGSLGSNASLIRTLTAVGVSGSFSAASSSLETNKATKGFTIAMSVAL